MQANFMISARWTGGPLKILKKHGMTDLPMTARTLAASYNNELGPIRTPIEKSGSTSSWVFTALFSLVKQRLKNEGECSLAKNT